MQLMRKLQQERLVVAAMVQASAEQVLEDTLAYVQERKTFGKPISKFQNTQLKLVECATQIEVGRAFLDRLLTEHVAGESLVKECSMAKLGQTEMLSRVMDECLQFFGGYGYMLEYPISRAFMDARVQRMATGPGGRVKTERAARAPGRLVAASGPDRAKPWEQARHGFQPGGRE